MLDSIIRFMLLILKGLLHEIAIKMTTFDERNKIRKKISKINFNNFKLSFRLFYFVKT